MNRRWLEACLMIQFYTTLWCLCLSLDNDQAITPTILSMSTFALCLAGWMKLGRLHRGRTIGLFDPYTPDHQDLEQ